MKRYRRAREMAGLSITQAARLLGLRVIDVIDMESAHPSGLCAWLSPDKVAEIYGVSAAWLEGAEPNLPPVARELLRQMESTSDRAKVTELLEALYTEAKP